MNVHDANALIIHTDGSSLILDGFAGGCAGIVEYPEECNKPELKLSWSYNPSTIGQMELRAVCNAIMWVNKNTEVLKNLNITRVIIINDRLDNVNGIKYGMYVWQKNGWKGKDNRDLKNLVAWKDIYRERNKLKFNFDVVWEKGKKRGLAKEADRLAKENAIKTIIDKVNYDMTPRKVGTSITRDQFELVEIPKNISRGIIRIYYHFPINNKKHSEAEIRFELIENIEIVGRFKAVSTGELNAKSISRHHYYLAQFNHDKSYSMIEDVNEIMGDELDSLKKKIKSKYGHA